MKRKRAVRGPSRTRVVALAIAVLVFSPPAVAEQHIVKEGRPCAEIVIAENPVPVVKVAADDLQQYVEKITGAKLPIVTAPTDGVPVQIYVGKSPHTDRLKISCDDLKHGAYRMVSGDNWLALIGRDRRGDPTGLKKLAVDKKAWVAPGRRHNYDHPLWKEWDKTTGAHWGLPFSQFWKQHNKELDIWEMDERGSYNAVAAFLRMQGVRWYMAGELGEIVPKKKDIALPKIDRTVRPDFELRYPYIYGYRFAGSVENMMWQLRMGFNQAADVVGEGYRAHGIAHVIGREETKKAHPEYYALQNGKRVTGGRFKRNGVPCLTSPELIDANVRFVRAMFDVFDMPMVSVMPVDGYTSICKCERCEGKGQPERGWKGQFSNYVWDYCNKVAQEVYKTHPDRKVVGMGYTTYMEPPTSIDKLSPNLLVSIAQHRCGFTQDAEQREYIQKLRKDWLAKLPEGGKNLYQYDYYRYAVPGKAGQFTPAFFPRAIAWDLRRLKGISLGDFIEVYHGLRNAKDAKVITELNLYVTGRCWWNANLDIDALLEEYYTLFYGPARNEMKAFIEYSENNWMDLKKVEKIDKVFELLKAAQAKAPEGSVYAKRIALIADYIEPLKDRRTQLAAPRDNVPRAVLITRDDAVIKIDGKLDEEAWQRLRTNGLRDLITGKPSRKTRTRCHIFWAKGSIYVGIVCEEPDLDGLNIATKQNDDTTIWEGDLVEILIETQSHAYYQLAISPSGALVDLDRKGGLKMLWSSNAEVGAHIGGDTRWGDKVWTVEVRIPVAGEDQANIDPNNGLAGRMPSNAYPWYFNVCRQRVRDGKQEHWAFSPTGKSGFHHPRKFAEMGGIIRDPKERERRQRLRQEWLKQWE